MENTNSKESDFPMNNFNKELVTSLIKGDGVNKLFNKCLENAVNEISNNELSGFLKYEPYEGVNVLMTIEMVIIFEHSKRSLESYTL